MTEKKLNRGFKILLNILIFLISLALSLISWELCYKEFINDTGIKIILPYILMVLANLGISFCIVSQAITGFYKRSVKQATSSSKMKFVFAITVVMLTIVMTVICHIWFNFGYGPIW